VKRLPRKAARNIIIFTQLGIRAKNALHAFLKKRYFFWNR